MTRQAHIERWAIAYATAWKADILEHLGEDVPGWSEMDPGQREAMKRVTAVVLSAIEEAHVVVPRELTHALFTGFTSVNFRPNGDGHYTFRGDYGNLAACYQAMIREAVKEES